MPSRLSQARPELGLWHNGNTLDHLQHGTHHSPQLLLPGQPTAQVALGLQHRVHALRDSVSTHLMARTTLPSSSYLLNLLLLATLILNQQPPCHGATHLMTGTTPPTECCLTPFCAMIYLMPTLQTASLLAQLSHPPYDRDHPHQLLLSGQPRCARACGLAPHIQDVSTLSNHPHSCTHHPADVHLTTVTHT
jgi:hypothetical protein